jgi:hypothetical protein
VEQPAVITYTTCRDCGGLLHTTDGDTVHPLCTPRPTRVEQLAEQWLDAVLAGDAALEAELHTRIEDIDNRAPRLLDAALLYASWGWPVFPLKTTAAARRAYDPYKAAKTPATKNGFKDATTDAGMIRDWWTRNTDSGIGLATGHAFDVIDIDTHASDGGTDSYTAIMAMDKKIHGRVTTASGGVHLYVQPTGEGCRTRMRPGVDFRGVGGYVIAPPTRLLGERRYGYAWAFRPSPVLTGSGDTYGVA